MEEDETDIRWVNKVLSTWGGREGRRYFHARSNLVGVGFDHIVFLLLFFWFDMNVSQGKHETKEKRLALQQTAR